MICMLERRGGEGRGGSVLDVHTKEEEEEEEGEEEEHSLLYFPPSLIPYGTQNSYMYM